MYISIMTERLFPVKKILGWDRIVRSYAELSGAGEALQRFERIFGEYQQFGAAPKVATEYHKESGLRLSIVKKPSTPSRGECPLRAAPVEEPLLRLRSPSRVCSDRNLFAAYVKTSRRVENFINNLEESRHG